ncbi:MAG TPA: DNA translocase FtsK 4TM domain-containing protein [Saprospiraceae bacterium]|nr:DNA translocase FtsK 4TM domain-containing protein [Saprospiraceae bacterium]
MFIRYRNDYFAKTKGVVFIPGLQETLRTGIFSTTTRTTEVEGKGTIIVELQHKQKYMAAKKKKKKGGQLSLRLGIKDERVPKLAGVLLLFLSLYFFIAFTSYLFTWKVDQNLVLKFSWELLIQSQFEMANWLGRLGAIVSNMFFYWGFGIASYLFIYIFATVGVSLIRMVPLKKYIVRIRFTIISILLLSVLLEFLTQGAPFPWGGAFGESVNQWLYRFVGAAGIIVLYIFVVLSMIVWYLNPDFNEMTFSQILQELRYFFSDLLEGRIRRPKPGTSKNVSEAQNKLRPGHRSKALKEQERTPLIDMKEEEVDEVLTLRPGQHATKEQQLAFNLENEKSKAKAKAADQAKTEAELEIKDTNPEQEHEENKRTMPNITFASSDEEEHVEPYDPTLDLGSYEYPVTQLMNDYSDQQMEIDREELEANKDQIIETLLNYKIEITKIRATIGPTVTLYEIVPAPGVRISKIKNLEDDIALSLAALGIRIIAPIPGKGTIGIEVPNKKKQIVSMREVLMSEKFKRAKMDLPIALGKTISNEVFVADLSKMPHLLVAGATGQGKSVGINAIIASLLYKKHPSQVKLVLIDPKKVELFPYSKLEHHFLAYLPNQDEPITTETNRVIHTLNSLCIEMDNRYDLLKKASARNLKEYNTKFVQRRLNPHKGHRFMPFIVLIIDEFADLIMTAGKEIEMPIGRLAQLARAVGIHLVIATQRPSVNIITGIIKANFPARIAYKVMAKVDSRTILDAGGADQLIGRGDMLFSVGGEMVRLQGAFIDTPEVERMIEFIAEQRGYPEPHYLPEFHGEEEIPGASGLKYSDLDELFEEAAKLVVGNQHGSTSMIQRRLKLGYNRAGRIMDQMEAMGIVGPSEGSKAREVLIYDEVELQRFLDDIKTK